MHLNHEPCVARVLVFWCIKLYVRKFSAQADHVLTLILATEGCERLFLDMSVSLFTGGGGRNVPVHPTISLCSCPIPPTPTLSLPPPPGLLGSRNVTPLSVASCSYAGGLVCAGDTFKWHLFLLNFLQIGSESGDQIPCTYNTFIHNTQYKFSFRQHILKREISIVWTPFVLFKSTGNKKTCFFIIHDLRTEHFLKLSTQPRGTMQTVLKQIRQYWRFSSTNIPALFLLQTRLSPSPQGDVNSHCNEPLPTCLQEVDKYM